MSELTHMVALHWMHKRPGGFVFQGYTFRVIVKTSKYTFRKKTKQLILNIIKWKPSEVLTKTVIKVE